MRTTLPEEIRILGEGDMPGFARELAARLAPGMLVFLEGGLGAGKTSLVRELAASYQVSELVSSPSFALINLYHGRLPHAGTALAIAHFDLYRLEGPDALVDIGADEYFDGRHLVFVEWPERAASFFPSPQLVIRFTIPADLATRTLALAWREEAR